MSFVSITSKNSASIHGALFLPFTVVKELARGSFLCFLSSKSQLS
jgi:hypothetical protein